MVESIKMKIKKWTKNILNVILKMNKSSSKNMQDPVKIQRKIVELNERERAIIPMGQTVGTWQEVTGYYALTGVQIGAGRSLTFNPSRGIPSKAFINVVTREIKIFPAIDFELE